MADNEYQPPPMPEEVTAMPLRGFHMFVPKDRPGIVLRLVAMNGEQHFFHVEQLEYFARVVEVWNTDLKAMLAAQQETDTPTWRQMTMEIATMLLPLDPAERDTVWQRLAMAYVTSLRAAGHGDEAIADNLRRMLARVCECVATLEASGGQIGRA